MTFALIAARLVLAALTLTNLHASTADMWRFHELAAANGIPYRDYLVEFAPLELAVTRVVGIGSIGQVAVHTVLLSLLVDLGIFVTLTIGWNRRIGTAYLMLGVALFPFRYLLPYSPSVLLATIGFALARRRMDRAAGTSFALAVLYKLWPLVLLPLFLGRGRRRLIAWFVLVAGLGMLGWTIVGGPVGVWGVMTFRGARGWEIEGTPGIISWISGSELYYDQGSVRVGQVELWARAGLALILFAALVLTWRRARSRIDPSGVSALSAVSILLALSPLFSAQYVIWLLPWAAVAMVADDDAPSGILTAIVCLLTSVEGILLFLRQTPAPMTPTEITVAQSAIVARNLLCGWLWLRGVFDRSSESRQEALTDVQ